MFGTLGVNLLNMGGRDELPEWVTVTRSVLGEGAESQPALLPSQPQHPLPPSDLERWAALHP